MGSQRLKIKDDLRYGRRSTSSECRACDHFIDDVQIRGISGVVLGREPRCRIIGLDPSRKYRINPQLHCDRYSQLILMLKWNTLRGERLEAALKARKEKLEFLAELKAKEA